MHNPAESSSRERLREIVGQHWKPTPIEPPAVDPDLPELNGLQRSAEVIRVSILSLEWWLSPKGTLREWCRLHGKISSILIIPAVLVIPVVTFILWQLATWMSFLVAIAGNLIVVPIAALLAIAAIAAVVTLLRAIFGK